MAAIAKVRVEPKRAGEIALRFTDSGRDGRPPGGLFEQGQTFLVMSPGGEAAQFMAFDPNRASLNDLFEVTGGGSALIIDLGEIVDGVAARLSTIPSRVVASAGPGSSVKADA